MTTGQLELLLEQPAMALDLPAGGGSGLLANGVLLLCGWSLRETTGGAPAVFELHDGTDSGGGLVASVAIEAGKSKELGPGTAGVGVDGGLYLSMISGAMAGVIWVRLRPS